MALQFVGGKTSHTSVHMVVKYCAKFDGNSCRDIFQVQRTLIWHLCPQEVDHPTVYIPPVLTEVNRDANLMKSSKMLLFTYKFPIKSETEGQSRSTFFLQCRLSECMPLWSFYGICKDPQKDSCGRYTSFNQFEHIQVTHSCGTKFRDIIRLHTCVHTSVSPQSSEAGCTVWWP